MGDAVDRDFPPQLTVKLEDGGGLSSAGVPLHQQALPISLLQQSYPHLASALGNQLACPTAAALLGPPVSMQQFQEQQQRLQLHQQQQQQQLRVQQLQQQQQMHQQQQGMSRDCPTLIRADTGSNLGSRSTSPTPASVTSSADNLEFGGRQQYAAMQFITGPVAGSLGSGNSAPQRSALHLNQLAETEQRSAAAPDEGMSTGMPSRPPSPTGATDGASSASICGVCGDRSHNIRKHYGANSCEACKCFFRRSVQMDKQYQCRYSMKCPIGSDKRVRHWCQYCRFMKCLTVGMKKDGTRTSIKEVGESKLQTVTWGDSEEESEMLHNASLTVGLSPPPRVVQKPPRPEAVKLHRNSFLTSGGTDSGRSSPVTTGKTGGEAASELSSRLLPPPLQTKITSPLTRELSSPPIGGAFATNPPSPTEMQAADRIKAEMSPAMLAASLEAAAAAAVGHAYMPAFAQLHHVLPDAPDLIPSSSLRMGGAGPGSVTGSTGSIATGPPSSSSMENDPFPIPPMPNINIASSDRSNAEDGSEASVEEVLETFKHRILCLFQWSKQHVVGFSELSAADQKALLRNSVVEIVMLGFAKRSIGFDGSLQLVTGKMMSPGHVNPGVSAVANLLLDRVVKPLRQLNLNDYEHMLLKQVILFNPVSSGVQDAETVRNLRKIRLIELQEYTAGAEPGRMGEMLCLIPPLYEVSQEIVEQLRLEQFVNDGEMRFDAVLLMSIVNGEVSLTTVDPTADPALMITPPAAKPPPAAGSMHQAGRSTSPNFEF